MALTRFGLGGPIAVAVAIAVFPVVAPVATRWQVNTAGVQPLAAVNTSGMQPLAAVNTDGIALGPV